MVRANCEKNFEFFLKSDFGEYTDNEWLTICGDKVVAHGLNLKEVMKQVNCVSGAMRPLFTRVKKVAQGIG